jgi:O-antigen/teichoic acid export membrane protein
MKPVRFPEERGRSPRLNLRHLMRHSALYGVGRILLRSLDLLLLPLYTRVLSVSDIGLVSLGAAIILVLGLVLPLGLSNALLRFFFDDEEGSDPQRRMLGTLTIAMGAGGLLVTTALSFAGVGVVGGLLDGMSQEFFQLILWGSFCNLFFPLWLQLLQVRREPTRFIRFSLAYAVARGGLTVLIVVYLDHGGVGWAEAYLVSGVLSGLVGTVSIMRTASFAVDRDVLRAAVVYSLPLLVHQVATWTSVFISRLMLNQGGTLVDVAIFQVGFGIGQIMSLLTSSVNAAYAPFFLASATRDPKAASLWFGQLTTPYMAGLLGVFVVVSLLAAPAIRIVAPPEYGIAVDIVPVVTLAFVLQGAYFVLVNPVFYNKSITKFLPWITTAGALVSVGASYALIPRVGALGAALAGLLSNAALVVGIYPLSQRALATQYDWRRIGGVFAVGAGIVFLIWPPLEVALKDASVLTSYAVRGLLVGCYLLGIWQLRCFEYIDMSRSPLGSATRVSSSRNVDL